MLDSGATKMYSFPATNWFVEVTFSYTVAATGSVTVTSKDSLTVLYVVVLFGVTVTVTVAVPAANAV